MVKKRFKYAEFCQSCRKQMTNDDQIVYVEQNSNRFFCSEKCIRSYYDPLADYYRAEHFSLRDPHDIPENEFTKYESYAPLCLSNPDELWVDTNDNGETFHCFHKSFTDEGGAFHYIIMCFCLELEPTYLIMAFPTRDRKLVEEYKRGKRLDLAESPQETEAVQPEARGALEEEILTRQSTAVEEEMLRWRSKADIAPSDFDDYAHLLEQTIENPDEVWEVTDSIGGASLNMITQHEDGLHYIVICSHDPIKRGGQESWNVIYSFPTRDEKLVHRYRRGALREGNSNGTSTLMQ